MQDKMLTPPVTCSSGLTVQSVDLGLKSVSLDDMLNMEVMAIVEQQFNELGFADIHDQFAIRLAEAEKEINAEHDEIRSLYNIIDKKISDLVATQEGQLQILDEKCASRAPQEELSDPRNFSKNSPAYLQQASSLSKGGSARLKSAKVDAVIIIDDDDDDAGDQGEKEMALPKSVVGISPLESLPSATEVNGAIAYSSTVFSEDMAGPVVVGASSIGSLHSSAPEFSNLCRPEPDSCLQDSASVSCQAPFPVSSSFSYQAAQANLPIEVNSTINVDNAVDTSLSMQGSLMTACQASVTYLENSLESGCSSLHRPLNDCTGSNAGSPLEERTLGDSESQVISETTAENALLTLQAEICTEDGSKSDTGDDLDVLLEDSSSLDDAAAIERGAPGSAKGAISNLPNLSSRGDFAREGNFSLKRKQRQRKLPENTSGALITTIRVPKVVSTGALDAPVGCSQVGKARFTVKQGIETKRDAEQETGPGKKYACRMEVFAKPGNSDLWYAGIIKRLVDEKRRKRLRYSVHFLSGMNAIVSTKHICPAQAPRTKDLEIGSRVVAGRPIDTVEDTVSKRYKDTVTEALSDVMFAGIVAELACEQNKNQYLVFFDDGYAQYYPLTKLHHVTGASKEVWRDVALGCRDFIKEYLQEYPYRQMVITSVGQAMKTEWNGIWWDAKVAAIEGSMVLVVFDIDMRSEWIYLGSSRLEPLAIEFNRRAQEAAGTSTQPCKKISDDGPDIDFKITHPNFGISKFSSKDPNGVMQRKEWSMVQSSCSSTEAARKRLRESGSGANFNARVARSIAARSGKYFKGKKEMMAEFKKRRPSRVLRADSTAVSELQQSAEAMLKKLKRTLERPEKPLSLLRLGSLGRDGAVRSRVSERLADSTTRSRPADKSPAQPQLESESKPWQAPWVKLIKKRKGPVDSTETSGTATSITDVQAPPAKKIVTSVPVVSPANDAGPRDDNGLLFIPSRHSKTPRYGPHTCSPACVADAPLPSREKGKHNFFAIPLLLGWTRECAKRRPPNRKDVYYRTPCGKRLRSIHEVSKYLLEARAIHISIDMFTFDPRIVCRDRVPLVKAPKAKVDDLSNGKETVVIECVNEVNEEYPSMVEYISTRIVADDVVINTDLGFLSSCDCTDNCQDKSRCQCAQLTVEASSAIRSHRKGNAGYYYRRLKECITTGIYECNQNCACSLSCHNRVVQNGIQLRLQVFMTERKGWGLRCLDDIPKGTFLCTYVGQVLTEELANKEGMDFGDEYLAELDHLEVVERAKEGYESDVPELRAGNAATEDSDMGTVSTYTISTSDDSSDEDSHTSERETGVKGGNPQSPAKICKDPERSSLEVESASDSSTSICGNRSEDDGHSVQVSAGDSAVPALSKSSLRPARTFNTEKLQACRVRLQRIRSRELRSRLLGSASSTTKDLSADGKSESGSLNRSCAVADEKRRSPVDVALECSLQEGALSNAVRPGLVASVLARESVAAASAVCASPSKSRVPLSSSPTQLSGQPLPLSSISVECIKSNVRNCLSLSAMSPRRSPCSSPSSDKEAGSVGQVFRAMARKSALGTSVFPQKPFVKQRAFAIKSTGGNFYSSPRSHTGGHFMKPSSQGLNSEHSSSTGNSGTRALYGDATCFVIDAKSFGNVGRYLNHSCCPNLFVQNVFVDTHDLRFPWVSFFTHENIPALTELTWDYSYEVGSVKDKFLTCRCGAAECRGRLL